MRIHLCNRPVSSVMAIVIAAAGLGLVAPAVTATASPRSTLHSRARGLDPAVLNIMSQQHVTLVQAETRLSWQQRVPALTVAVRHYLPAARFGGIWIAPNDGDRVKIGVVGFDAHSWSAVAKAVHAADLTAATDLVPVRYSASQLEGADAWLGGQLVKLARRSTGPIHLNSDYRLDLNQVELGIAGGNLTTAERGLISRARARYGSVIHVARVSGHAQVRPGDCTYPYCYPSLRGGIRIESPNNQWECTGGFIASSRTDGKLYEFTAGHCAADGGSGNWWTEFPDHSVHAVGPVHHYILGSNGDMAILAINNPTGWKLPQGWVYVTANPGVTTLNEEYPISSAQYSTQGQRICKSGANYGETTCGVVTALGQTVQYPNGIVIKNLGEANFCSIEGDSGGPVFASHQAFGIFVAYDAQSATNPAPVVPCVSYYQGIIGASNAMNVNVVLAH